MRAIYMFLLAYYASEYFTDSASYRNKALIRLALQNI